MMKQRRSIRFEGHDYSSCGGYFVTLVTHHRENLFGEIVNGVMQLNELGLIVNEEWFNTQILRPSIELIEDEFVVMPNHIHGIIWIIGPGKEVPSGSPGKGDLQVALVQPTLPMQPKGPISNSVGSIIGGFKAAVTKRINLFRGTCGQPVWLRNFYEHIIRTEKEYFNIANYIHDNPVNWELKDEYFSDGIS